MLNLSELYYIAICISFPQKIAPAKSEHHPFSILNYLKHFLWHRFLLLLLNPSLFFSKLFHPLQFFLSIIESDMRVHIHRDNISCANGSEISLWSISNKKKPFVIFKPSPDAWNWFLADSASSKDTHVPLCASSVPVAPPFLQFCLMVNRCSYKPFFIGFNRNQNSCSDSYCRKSRCLYQFICLWQADSHLCR